MATGPSSSDTPYLVPLTTEVSFTSIVTTGDSLDIKVDPPGHAGEPYRFVGIPDGIGAFDNGDGTLTVLVNHELGDTLGVERSHGATGAFIAKLTLDKATLAVTHAEDLIQRSWLWDATEQKYVLSADAFSRFCSGDLPAEGAFYNAVSGHGYSDGLIYLNGEETGAEGRAFAHVASGPLAGTSYELPYLGKFSWENSVANPDSGDKTIVVGTDDATGGELYVYVGDKQDTGTPVDQAGLSNGKLYGVMVGGPALEDRATAFGAEELRFSLVELGTNGDVSGMTGAELQTQSDALGISGFLRPEDGAWDTVTNDRFYFVTTDTFDEFKIGADGSDSDSVIDEVGRSRLWRLDFDDIANPALGGKIEMLLDGTEQQEMMDNITVNSHGQVLIQEDPGGQPYSAKILAYNPETDELTQLAQHDPTRFGDIGVSPTAPFNDNEESSGIIDVIGLLGPAGKDTYLLDVQAHYSIADGELVEGGQLLTLDSEPLFVNDTLRGGDADETLDGRSGFDRIDGGDGYDTLLGGSGDDYLTGGNGEDSLSGGTGNDRAYGGDANDVVFGGTGDDTIRGDDGADTLDGEAGNDQVLGGNGNDAIEGGIGNDRLAGGDDEDMVGGGAGRDTLTGDDGNDMLLGGADLDRIDGGNGDDTIVGGAGADRLHGNDGMDLFVFAAGDGGMTISAADRIYDYVDGTDHIGLAGGLTFADLTIDQGDNRVGGASPNDAVVSIMSTGEILFVTQDVSSLDASDFILV